MAVGLDHSETFNPVRAYLLSVANPAAKQPVRGVMRIWPLHLVLVGAIILVAGLFVAGCSPLGLYNGLTPADAGSARVGTDIAYGDHPRQRLDIYTPDAAAKPAPVVVIFYGGSWNSGRKEDYAFLGRAIAARGFVAVIADYRLVPHVRFPAFLDDGARAIAWAQAHAREYNGDPGRIFLLGHSAGAYNAAMIALDGRYLHGAGSSTSAIRAVAALAGPYDFLPLDVASTIAAFGQANDLAQTQPINFVTRPAPPMLLATGDADTTVKPRNTRALAEKLRAAGAEVVVRTYPGVGHVGILLALSRPLRGKAPVLDDVAAFFDAHR